MQASFIYSLLTHSSIILFTFLVPVKSMAYNLRRYQSSDLPQVKQLFADNLREEWRDTYHEGKYATNAEGYIERVVSSLDSDMNNIECSYFADTEGYFWVLECNKKSSVVGTCGLQRVSSTTAEIRRLCMAKDHRRNGNGTNMLQIAIQHATNNMNGINKLVVSTVEHSIEGIDFYKTKNGFVDSIDESTGLLKAPSPVHGTPICEVFMEYEIKG